MYNSHTRLPREDIRNPNSRKVDVQISHRPDLGEGQNSSIKVPVPTRRSSDDSGQVANADDSDEYY